MGIRNFLTAAAFEARMAMWSISDILRSEGRKADSRQAKRFTRLHGPKKLEERCLLHAGPLGALVPDMDMLFAIETAPAYVGSVTAGATDVPLMQLSIGNVQGNNRADSITLQATGTGPFNKVVDRINVIADFNHDGIFNETPISTLTPTSGKFVYDIPTAFDRITTMGGNISLGFFASTKANAPTADIGLDVVGINGLDQAGKKIKAQDISLLDLNGSTVRVEAQNNALTVTVFQGGASDELQKGKQSVVNGYISFDTTQGDMVMKRIDLAAEARDGNGVLTANVNKEVTGLQLVNTVTNQTVTARAVSNGIGNTVYQLENFTVKKGDVWRIVTQLSADASVKDGDMYRIRVNLVETDKSPTTFGGLLAKEAKGLDLEAMDADSGRKVTVVYPSGTLMTNFVRIGQTSAQVAVQSMASADTAVANEKGVTVFRFLASAKNGDVNIYEPFFDAQQGSLLNMTNYGLFADLNGDGTAETQVGRGVVTAQDGAGTNAHLHFYDMTNGGQIVRKDTVMAFEVRGDVSSSLMPDSRLQLRMLDIEAEKVSGGQQIPLSISQGSSTLWTFVKQGDLTVTKSIIPLQSQQLLGGRLSDPVLAFTVYGNNEAIDVTKIPLWSLGSFARSVDRLELYVAGATTPFAIATTAMTGSDPVPAGTSVFTTLTQSRQLVVPEGEQVTILVRARIKTDDQGAVEGETIQFVLGNVEARGLASSNNVTVASPAQVVGTSNYVVFAKIGSIANASSMSDGAPIVQGVQQERGVLRIDSQAHANTLNGLESIEIDGLVVTDEYLNVLFNADSYRMYNKLDPSIYSVGRVFDMNGVEQHGNVVGNGKYQIRFGDLIDSFVRTNIDPGQSIQLGFSNIVEDARVNDALPSLMQLSYSDFGDINASVFGTMDSHLLFAEMGIQGPNYHFGAQSATTVVRMTRFQG